MKCFYAIPRESLDQAQKLCREYTRLLESFSESAITFGDDLRTFADSTSKSQIQLCDDDWEAVKSDLSKRGPELNVLTGEVFWSSEAAKSVADSLDTFFSRLKPSTTPLARWVRAQVKRGHCIILLAK